MQGRCRLNQIALTILASILFRGLRLIIVSHSPAVTFVGTGIHGLAGARYLVAAGEQGSKVLCLRMRLLHMTLCASNVF